MDPTTQIEDEIKKYMEERSKLFDEVCTEDIAQQQIRTILEIWTDQLIYHLRRVFNCGKILNSQKEQNIRSRGSKTNKKNKEKKSEKRNNQEKRKEYFTKLVTNYQSSNYTEEKWRQNKWVDWELEENNWHTKSRCPKQGLHLVVHHLGGNGDKQAYRNGFTIVRDPRFKNGREGHWPLRIELEPIFDKIRKTRTYIVIKNEFGKRELNPKFYKRMQETGMTLKDYNEVLEANRDGLWKKHPMRKQTDGKNMRWVPLRFNLNKEQWKKIIESKSFANVTITRQLGKNWRKDQHLAKEIIAYADSNGIFNMSEQILENWRKANKPRDLKEGDMNVDRTRHESQN